MNFEKVLQKKRKAISPVLATVILIAITLIAAVAIAGFVFGLFGSFTSSAQIQASTVAFPASLTSAALSAPVCQATSIAADAYMYVQNTGTSSATVNAVTLTYGGHTSTIAATTCSVPAGGAVYLNFAHVEVGGVAASTGEQFTGSLATSNGGSVPFSGSFQ